MYGCISLSGGFMTGLRTLFALLAAFAVCGGAQAEDTITPQQAIERAADAAPAGVKGVFVMDVRGTGRQDGNLYLNSQVDYRDQRNLTIAIAPDIAAALQTKFGDAPDTFLVGKRIAVTGEAKRVTIWFLWNGVPTEKYYYQTHVALTAADQLQILK